MVHSPPLPLHTLLQARVDDALEALHGVEVVAQHHQDLELVLAVLSNAALPRFLPTVQEHVQHPHFNVRVAAVTGLGRFPPAVAAPTLARVLNTPPSFDALLEGHLDVDLKRHALGVMVDMQRPPLALLTHLHSHLQAFYGVHGDHPVGCMGRCDDACAEGVGEDEPGLVTQPCRDRCRGACAEVVAYHASVDSVLRVHARALGEGRARSLHTSSGLLRRLFDLPEFEFHIGELKEASHQYGSSDVGLRDYTMFQNMAKLEASIRGVSFLLVSDNVFQITGELFGLSIPIMKAQAGFQVLCCAVPCCARGMFC
jgi:hypothetical protein